MAATPTHQMTRAQKHQITLELILSFIRCMKTKKYSQCPRLLYEIRTSDLREMLLELGPDHLFYRTLLDLLRDPKLEIAHVEGLYNLAVVLSERRNVSGLLAENVIDVIWKFAEVDNTLMQHHACWCFFGIASSAPEHREVCLKRGVLSLVLSRMLKNSVESVADMCGQVIYGMFHLKPVPDPVLTQSFFRDCHQLLKLPEAVLKYVLWAIHFASTADSSFLLDQTFADSLRPLLRGTQASVLIPLTIIIGTVFQQGTNAFDAFLEDLLLPIVHKDPKVRLQTCRGIADYVRDENTIEDMFNQGIYAKVIKLAETDELRVREQAVYCVVRGFGLGGSKQKERLAEMNGLKVLLMHTPIAMQPFNCNLVDCMHSLLDENLDYFLPKMREIRAVKVLYQLLSSPDQVLTSRVANLLGILGDDYSPAD
jgi:hypothetical protein